MISGMWVYLYSVVDGISLFLGIVGGFMAFGTLTIGVIFFAENYDEIFDEYEDTIEKKIFKFAIKANIISLIFILVACLLPSKETLITMKVFDLATKENINWTIEQAKSIIDYLVESVAKIIK